jgi:hypothetical protein
MSYTTELDVHQTASLGITVSSMDNDRNVISVADAMKESCGKLLAEALSLVKYHISCYDAQTEADH